MTSGRRRPGLLTPETLTIARIAAKLSQAELGRKAGVSESVIQRFELGATVPRADTIAKLHIALAESHVELKSCEGYEWILGKRCTTLPGNVEGPEGKIDAPGKDSA